MQQQQQQQVGGGEEFVIQLKREPKNNSYSLIYAGVSNQKEKSMGKQQLNANSAQKKKEKKINPKQQQPTQQQAVQQQQEIKEESIQQNKPEIIIPKAKKSIPDQKQEVASSVKEQSINLERESEQALEENKEGSQIEETQDQIIEDQGEYAKTSFIIPSCSSWFNIEKVHEIEMQSLPEFFCGKFPHKTPETYYNYRNFIIKLYRESPNSYLSAIICRKNIPGDVCSIIRLHAFLEHWGIINFNVDPLLKPPKIYLTGSGAINSQLIDIATKGYIKVSEAEYLAQQFQKEQNQQQQQSLYNQQQQFTQPPPLTLTASDNVFVIAAKKINMISQTKRPTCNFCGNICGQYWYKKKINQNSFIQKDEQYLKGLGEQDSLHSVLKQLVSTYVVCKECFQFNNFPHILTKEDFEKCTLQNVLKLEQFLQKKEDQIENEDRDNNDANAHNIYSQLEQPQEWTLEEKEKLINAITEYHDDWELIALEVFANGYTPIECALQFLRLPITESLVTKLQSSSMMMMTGHYKRGGNEYQEQHNSVNNGQQNAMMSTIFQDTSNPLQIQLGIFAKCLENQDKCMKEEQELQNKYQRTGGQFNQDSQQYQLLQAQNDKRATRKQMAAKKKEIEVNAQQQQQQQSFQKINNVDEYLVYPSSKRLPCLSPQVIEQIQQKAKFTAKRLKKQKRKQLEAHMNLILQLQLQKLEHKTKFLREFWQSFQIDMKDLSFNKEEILSERAALSILKSGESKGSNVEKVLLNNEFLANCNLLREIQK